MIRRIPLTIVLALCVGNLNFVMSGAAQVPPRGAMEELIRQSHFIFRCRVERTEASSLKILPPNAQTTVVRVQEVLYAPKTLNDFTGWEITVHMREPKSIERGQDVVFFLAQGGSKHLLMQRIYADVESTWKPTSGWFQGWSDTMFNSQFGGAGGIYGNPHRTNVANFNLPYCSAFNNGLNMQGTDGDAAYIFSSEPEPGCTTALQAPAFAPDTPLCNPNTVIWQYAENCFGGRVDEDLANDAGFQFKDGSRKLRIKQLDCNGDAARRGAGARRRNRIPQIEVCPRAIFI